MKYIIEDTKAEIGERMVPMIPEVKEAFKRSLANRKNSKVEPMVCHHISRNERKFEIMIKILFVCLGNICRSTMAESVMTHLITHRGLASCFHISSAATSREEIGNPPHYGTVSKLRQVGIPVVPHRAVQMTKADYEKYDYLIGMDSANIRNMTRIAGGDPEGKIYKLTSFAGRSGDIADPWYTGNFDETYEDVLAGCEGLLEYLLERM